MNMNHQNSAKRTIAGILAALSLISCTALPAVTAGAEEAAEPEIIETMTSAMETEEDTAVMAAEPETEAETEEDTVVMATEPETEAETEEDTAVMATEPETEAETQPVSVDDRSEAEKIQEYFDYTIASQKVIGNETFTDTQNGVSKKLQKTGDTIQIITKTPKEEKGNSNCFSTIGNIAKCYPGALVYADEDLIEGNPSFVNLERNSINLTVQNAPLRSGESPTIEVKNPSKSSDVASALTTLSNRFEEGADSAAEVECHLTSVISEEQLKATGSFNQSVYGKLKLDFSAASENKKQIVLLEYNQIYYTVNSDLQLGGAAFSPNETFQHVSSMITNDKPAAMITSVNYGRKIVACIETTDMSFDLKTALEASGYGDKAGGKASVDYNNKLSSCHVSYYVYGGTAGNSAKIIVNKTTKDLLNAINEEAKFTKNGALPISYTASFLKDGKTAQVNFCGKYCTTTIETRKPVPVTINADGRSGRLKSYTVKITGQRIKDIEDDGHFVLGENETLKEITMKSNGDNNDFVEFPADIDLSTVRVWFDYDGWGKTGFDDAVNGLRLTKDCSALNISKVRIEADSNLAGFFGYNVWGRVKVTDTNGTEHEQKVRDKK